jgi:hypothetical protein
MSDQAPETPKPETLEERIARRLRELRDGAISCDRCGATGLEENEYHQNLATPGPEGNLCPECALAEHEPELAEELIRQGNNAFFHEVAKRLRKFGKKAQ